MKRLLIFLIIYVFWDYAQAQVDLQEVRVLVGVPGTLVVVNDSTYNSTWSFEVDQITGTYYPTAIAAGWVALDGSRHLYRVDSVWNKTASSATLRLVELNPANGPPLGRGVVYEPLPEDPYLIPPGPENSDGLSPAQIARIHINNLRRSSGGGLFDSDRPIGRVPVVGTNIGGSTLVEWLEYWYFTVPTVSSFTQSPTTSIYEVGDSVQVIWSWTISNPSGATMSNGQFNKTFPNPDSTISTFGAAAAGSDTIQFVPQPDSVNFFKGFQYTFQVQQDWDSGSESGTATSAVRSITAVYPVLIGISNTDYSVGGNPYIEADFDHRLVTESDVTWPIDGTGFIYYLFPTSWATTDIQIIDHNGFDVTPSFTKYTGISVSSTGQVHDWTLNYTMYKLNTTTVASNFAYQFIRQ